MGMLDYYKPIPNLICPRCDQALNDWQGKDGDNALFVWEQGVRHPVKQCVDKECRLTTQELAQFTLPEEFTIVTHCTCSTKFLLEAFGTCIDGLWAHSRLIQPGEIEKIYAQLPRSQRKAMRLWLQERV